MNKTDGYQLVLDSPIIDKAEGLLTFDLSIKIKYQSIVPISICSRSEPERGSNKGNRPFRDSFCLSLDYMQKLCSECRNKCSEYRFCTVSAETSAVSAETSAVSAETVQ
ncbi:hypothetical protein L1987_65262 [Smallanthus sonchifolius]|uniref:Uncharacterized protein n=1 Tax=Smallanthus sonchifolius TaxID=185202 RepID=A0ACB9BTZ0_9ASTR|nr:hypothetical protein L1987_65262 [Smallanthus sonchifolius]